jgi:hypothetical protein
MTGINRIKEIIIKLMDNIPKIGNKGIIRDKERTPNRSQGFLLPLLSLVLSDKIPKIGAKNTMNRDKYKMRIYHIEIDTTPWSSKNKIPRLLEYISLKRFKEINPKI